MQEVKAELLNQKEVSDFIYDYIEESKKCGRSNVFRGFIQGSVFFIYATNKGSDTSTTHNCSGIDLNTLTRGHSLGKNIYSKLRRVMVNDNLIWFDEDNIGTVKYDRNSKVMTNDEDYHWSNYFEDGIVYEANLIGSPSDTITLKKTMDKIYIDDYVQLTPMKIWTWTFNLDKQVHLNKCVDSGLTNPLSFKVVTSGGAYDNRSIDLTRCDIDLIPRRDYKDGIHNSLINYHTKSTHDLMRRLVKLWLLEL